MGNSGQVLQKLLRRKAGYTWRTLMPRSGGAAHDIEKPGLRVNEDRVSLSGIRLIAAASEVIPGEESSAADNDSTRDVIGCSLERNYMKHVHLWGLSSA